MQFIKNGPDVPEQLLQSHEEGKVVFFCGAGISYSAGLPGFSGLVRQLFDELGTEPDDIQHAAMKAGQFDTVVGLLESNIVGERQKVRSKLAKILAPDLNSSKALETHQALLTLGRNRDGQFRLITTNFDRLFEEVIKHSGFSVERFKAPLLPVPKNRWDGLVYLHGLLPENPTASGLDRLVISSGDFGLAYLTERWAARFISELFQNYTVCFVGYSLNDPVLRYMTDALAADRLLGESRPEMFVFTDHSKNKETECVNEWRAKNVTPILYHARSKHYYLHQTLKAWAETYRVGILGKERVVTDAALTGPSASTQQDKFVERILWALSDLSGKPAKRFAELNPVPSLDWLDVFTDPRFQYSDLARFGVMPHSDEDKNLKFSLLNRPASYRLAPNMALTNGWGMSNWKTLWI